jgi:type IV pilus assembly protein PilB
MPNRYVRIGDWLIERGWLSQADLETALSQQNVKNDRRRLGTTLVALGMVSERQIAECLADQYGYAIADLSKISPQKAALRAISKAEAIARQCLPISLSRGVFRCVVADPLDFELTDDLARTTKAHVHLELAPLTELLACIEASYASLAPPKRVSRPRKVRIDGQEDRDNLLENLHGAFAGAQSSNSRKAA